MDSPGAITLLKGDTFGRVELVDARGMRVVRRVALGSRMPLSRLVAARLLARERAALRVLRDVEGVPHLHEDGSRERGVLLRSFLDGTPLHEAAQLPEDFFDLLEALVRELHANGVCHNDLHKEPNILVDPAGRPMIVDFQLASLHPRQSGALFRSRVRDDLRHVAKHRARYQRATGVVDRRSQRAARRGVVAKCWLLLAKPIYNFVTRRLLHRSDDEPRRPREGPWPVWVAAIGARPDRSTASR